MTSIKCKVMEVLYSPYMKHGRWFVDIKYVSIHGINQTQYCCIDEEEAFLMVKGYEFYL